MTLAIDLSGDRLTEQSFLELARLIEDHSGIRMPAGKQLMLEARLRKRVRALELPGLEDYCAYLFDPSFFDAEFVHLIDAATTNKTEFFREIAHFDFLRAHGVKHLLSLRRPGADRTLKIWSAACSIGAEAYTIAMLLADMAESQPGLSFSILGTDICTTVLEEATQGIYPIEMVEPVPEAMKKRYLLWPKNPSQRQVRVVPELRRTAQFSHLNLMDKTYPVDENFDIIFCRNILIYFDKETQAGVLERLCRHLRVGGYLILGHAESMVGIDLSVQQIKPSIYQRT